MIKALNQQGELKIKEKSYSLFDYRFNNGLSLISFYLAFEGLSAYIEIRFRGSVKITLSYAVVLLLPVIFTFNESHFRIDRSDSSPDASHKEGPRA